MSLALLEGYSSEEDEAAAVGGRGTLSPSLSDDGDEQSDADDKDDDGREEQDLKPRGSQRDDRAPSASGVSDSSATSSGLPSASAAFSEITRPPDFLNNRVAEPEETREALGVLDRRSKDRVRRERKDLPAGAVFEAKAQLVGIRERVRSDVEGSHSASSVTANGEAKRVFSATIPDKKDASELLRVCMQCGVPKTYSHARGMLCPICGDRPPPDEQQSTEKKKGSIIKDKEKVKRMRGQSSHATWKSETEMHLRQQFD